MLITDLLDKYSSKQINLIKAMNSGKLGFENYLDNVFELEIHSQDSIPYTIAHTCKNYIDIKILIKSVDIKTKNKIQVINSIFKDASISTSFYEENNLYYIIAIRPAEDTLDFNYFIPRINKIIELLKQDVQISKPADRVIEIINNELKKHNDRLNYLRTHKTADKREPIKVQAYIEQLVNLKLLLGGK